MGAGTPDFSEMKWRRLAFAKRGLCSKCSNVLTPLEHSLTHYKNVKNRPNLSRYILGFKVVNSQRI